MLELCRGRRIIIVASFVVLTTALGADAGTVTGLTVSPSETQAGTVVTATATGTGPCGAVHINWGDGTAITYATSTLPVSQTHVYDRAGTYTVRAQGMGNCDGEATAGVTVKPAPAPVPAPRLTRIDLTPTPGTPRAPVTITLQGSGACRLSVDFGDGNTQEISGDLPLALRHTYALAGVYTIAAAAAPPCSGRQSTKLEVATADVPSLTRLEVQPVRGAARGRQSIEVVGTGRCAYVLDYGDGNTESRTAVLPDMAQHNYPAEGRYTIVATAQPPCVGVERATIVIGRSGEVQGTLTGLTVTPQLARHGQAVTITVAGTGTCPLTIDMDDGESRNVTQALPYRFTYRYERPGDYDIVAWAAEPCSGEADALLRVRRR